MEGRTVKILLVDDHTMFRQGLREMLSTDEEMLVVGEAGNSSEAVALAAEEKPDVVILDVEMPGMGAAGALEGLLALSPAPRVLIVSMYDSPRLVRDLLGRGASGYLVKSASLEELLTAVRQAVHNPRGEKGENVILAVPRSILEQAEEEDGGGISRREQEILLLAAEVRPDIVILDVEMPGTGAAATLQMLLALSPAPRVLIVSMYDSPRLVRDLLGRGASGYLVKSASLAELLTAVRRTARGPHDNRGNNVILTVPRAFLERVEGDEGRLSGREQEILLLAARGLSNREIAASAYLAEGTVKRHLANIYEKLGVSSRGEASQKALSEGWITAGDLIRQEDT